MCGISGKIALKGSLTDYQRVASSIHSLKKRGPDDDGIFVDEKVILGHTRLSIIDTSSLASQPFQDRLNNHVITYNGEIFNFKELRSELQKKGQEFYSDSDTEVLLALLKRNGISSLQQLNGFFAFAYYNKKDQTIIIARDRFGVKPLLYSVIPGEYVAFASEMKALKTMGIPGEIDEASLFSYLQLNYTPAPFSIYKNIRKLEAGQYLFIDLKNGQINLKTYYDIGINEQIFEGSYDEAKNKLKELLYESINKRLISDVPLGCFLSGGIDSSIITGIAAEKKKNIQTFSLGFKDEPYFDETNYAEAVSKLHNTHHTTFRLTNSDIQSHLYDVLSYIDEPFADSSSINLYILSKETRKNVTVALSGDGADELFGGYNKHQALLNAHKNNLYNFLIKKTHPIINKLPKSRNSKLGNIFRKLDKYAEGLNLSAPERYWRWASYCSESDAKKIYHLPEKKYYLLKSKFINSVSNDLNSILYSDFKLVLQNDMLTKVDLMSMANSLEVRTPFLDVNLVNFVFSLPDHFKIDGNRRKKILLDTFSHLLPKEVINRKKMGFEVPLLKLLRGELYSLIYNELLSKDFIYTQGIFNYDGIEDLKRKLMSANPNDSVARIWGLVVFQHWWKKNEIQ